MHNDNEIANYVFFTLRALVSKTLVCCHLNPFFLLSTILQMLLQLTSLISNPPPPLLLQSSVECLRENLHSLSPQSVGSQLEALVERTEDFTDSAYTSHEQRQAILGLCQLARQDTQQLVHAWVEAVCWHRQAHLHRCTYTYRNIHKNICYHMKTNNKYLICKTLVKEKYDNRMQIRDIQAKKRRCELGC